MTLLDNETGQYAIGAWEEDGITYHQVYSRLLIEGELIELLQWCDANVRSLVNRNSLDLIAAATDVRTFHAIMIFTDSTEAVHARIRWG